MSITKVALVGFLGLFISAFFALDGQQYLSLGFFQQYYQQQQQNGIVPVGPTKKACVQDHNETES